MRNFLLPLMCGLGLLGIVVNADCKDLESNSQKAIAAFESGNYEEAFKAWKQIATFNSDPDLFYNIGNSALLAGDIPEAIYAYEQYLRFCPGDKEVNELITDARKQIENSVVPLPKFFLLQWWNKALVLLRPGLWAILSLCAFSIAVGIWLSRLDRRNYFSFLKNQNIPGFFIAGVLLLCFALLSYRQIYRENEAIIFTECEMYQGPSSQSPLVRTIHPGEKVIIKDQLSDWKKVHLLNLDQGWIRNECIRIIDFTPE